MCGGAGLGRPRNAKPQAYQHNTSVRGVRTPRWVTVCIFSNDNSTMVTHLRPRKQHHSPGKSLAIAKPCVSFVCANACCPLCVWCESGSGIDRSVAMDSASNTFPFVGHSAHRRRSYTCVFIYVRNAGRSFANTHTHFVCCSPLFINLFASNLVDAIVVLPTMRPTG